MTMTDPEMDTAPPPGADEFMTWLATTGKDAADVLGEKMAALVAAVTETKKKGTLTYTITVEPAKQIEGMVLVTDAVTAKIPQAAREPLGMFYVHQGGKLSDYPPGQGKLFDPSAITAGGER